MTVVFYVSGHGFGHASRVIEVINAVLARRPDLAVHVRTRAARWLFDLTVAGPFTLAEVDIDVGVVQVDALVPDIAATMDRAARFYANADALVAREAQVLEELRAAIVIADLPPLALAAAHRAGVPAIGLGNFTWDWIYEDYARALGRDGDVPDRIRYCHSLARQAWRMPMHGGFEGFRAIRDLPLVARRSRHGGAPARAMLGLDGRPPSVLVSFGGIGLDGLPLDAVAASGEFVVVTTDEPRSSASPDHPLVRTTPGGVIVVDERRLYDHGLRYEDLVAAVDVVVTKPGYGIVAECAANNTAMLFTSRGRFAEYDVLVEALPGWLRSRFIPQAELREGRWAPHLAALLAQPPPPERPAADGADVAAEWLDEIL